MFRSINAEPNYLGYAIHSQCLRGPLMVKIPFFNEYRFEY